MKDLESFIYEVGVVICIIAYSSFLESLENRLLIQDAENLLLRVRLMLTGCIVRDTIGT